MSLMLGRFAEILLKMMRGTKNFDQKTQILYNADMSNLTSSRPEHSVPAEIPLENSPLKLVLAQVQFPPILAINQPAPPMLAAFQEEIRKDYPSYAQHTMSDMSVGVGPTDTQIKQKLLFTHSFKNSDGWEISLRDNSISLSTTSYVSRRDFAQKVKFVMHVLQTHVQPYQTSRLGVRFLNRVEDPQVVGEMEKYVNPDFWSAHSVFEESPLSLMTETIARYKEKGFMLIRWGLVAAKQPIGGLNVAPCPTSSWILDFDIFANNFPTFDSEKISESVENFSEEAYRFFRKIFNKKFIILCGGKP